MAHAAWTSAPNTGATGSRTIVDWALPLREGFLSVGFTKTADTGQVDMSTLVTPSAGIPGGYDMFAFFGPTQATHPIFFKIEYGGASSGRPMIWLTCGKGTDGLGGITGILIERIPFTLNSASDFRSENSLAADEGGFYLQTWATALYPVPAILIERARTPTGEPRGEGLLRGVSISGFEDWRAMEYANPSRYYSWIDSGTASTIWALPHSSSAVLPGNQSYTLPAASPGKAVALPLRAFAPGVEPWVSNLIISGADSDLSALGLFEVEVNGRSRTYKSFARNAATRALCAGIIPPMLWE